MTGGGAVLLPPPPPPSSPVPATTGGSTSTTSRALTSMAGLIVISVEKIQPTVSPSGMIIWIQLASELRPITEILLPGCKPPAIVP